MGRKVIKKLGWLQILLYNEDEMSTISILSRGVAVLRLSKMADYAGVIGVHMARDASRVHTATSLSEALELPKATVAKCLKTLAKSGVLASHRGVNGGYSLARAAKDISVAEVIHALEGPTKIASCTHGNGGDCQIVRTCPMRGGWDGINQDIEALLMRKTLAEMAGV